MTVDTVAVPDNRRLSVSVREPTWSKGSVHVCWYGHRHNSDVFKWKLPMLFNILCLPESQFQEECVCRLV